MQTVRARTQARPCREPHAEIATKQTGSDSIHSDILDFQPSGSGHRGNDVLIGGGGEDFFYANEGHRDTIFCGGGRDWVDADRRDIVGADCERVRGRG